MDRVTPDAAGDSVIAKAVLGCHVARLGDQFVCACDWAIHAGDLSAAVPVLARYTVDPTPAWQVVQRMVELRWYFHLQHGTSDKSRWIMQFGQPAESPDEDNHWGRFYIKHGDTAPLAICRAALLTLESERGAEVKP